jgi:hypothetical protein
VQVVAKSVQFSTPLQILHEVWSSPKGTAQNSSITNLGAKEDVKSNKIKQIWSEYLFYFSFWKVLKIVPGILGTKSENGYQKWKWVPKVKMGTKSENGSGTEGVNVWSKYFVSAY